MLKFLAGDDKKKKNAEVFESVSEGLKKLYRQKILPLEKEYKFHDFHSPALEDADFDAKPMVLLVGQYSTGKTTFIKYILEQDFPGIRIGPEPTTDCFIAIMHGETETIVPGNALVVDPKKQFRPLSKFGNAFLNRFQCSMVNNSVLKSLTIVDTPGILSGEKQRVDRGYDFTGILEWFAERADRIILLFDAHKLDISDEFKRGIESLRPFDEKIRIVLNKADGVDAQQLMRVYGALMWSLGKVLNTPEVPRVYIGSFWDQPLIHDVNRRLFEAEERDLFADLQNLPKTAAIRKLNDLIKRARLAKVHAYVISHLKKEMPSMFGKEKKQKELIQSLDKIYGELQRTYQISPGDFPSLQRMQQVLEHQDFYKFEKLKPKLLDTVDNMLAFDISKLMQMVSQENAAAVAASSHPDPGTFNNGGLNSLDSDSSLAGTYHKAMGGSGAGGGSVRSQKQSTHPAPNLGVVGGIFGDDPGAKFGRSSGGGGGRDSDPNTGPGGWSGSGSTPFGYGRGEGVDLGAGESGWIVDRDREAYDAIFRTLNPVDNKVTGASAKGEMVRSKLPNSVLHKVWKLADVDKDGYLDADEWALASYLIKLKVEGHDLPTTLPSHLVPPSKRFSNYT